MAKYELCLAYYRSFLEKVKSGAETLNEENALTESMQQIEPDSQTTFNPTATENHIDQD